MANAFAPVGDTVDPGAYLAEFFLPDEPYGRARSFITETAWNTQWFSGVHPSDKEEERRREDGYVLWDELTEQAKAHYRG